MPDDHDQDAPKPDHDLEGKSHPSLNNEIEQAVKNQGAVMPEDYPDRDIAVPR